MKIAQAKAGDLDTVSRIVQDTIGAVYPRYYPAGAVRFFREHHSREKIAGDIEAGAVYLIGDEGAPAGTVTVSGDEICRLFVLPQRQGNGYGRALLDFAEGLVARRYASARLDTSLPAKAIYLKRGYRETEYCVLETPGGDFLCHDVMAKALK